MMHNGRVTARSSSPCIRRIARLWKKKIKALMFKKYNFCKGLVLILNHALSVVCCKILTVIVGKMSDCVNLVIRRYEDESSDYSNLPN